MWKPALERDCELGTDSPDNDEGFENFVHDSIRRAWGKFSEIYQGGELG
jgi:hypothetical protein